MAVRITGAGVALTVGIIVVTGLIIGGLFWARNASEQARNAETAEIAQEQLEEQSNDDVALNGGDENKDENKDESTQSGGSEANNSATNGNGNQSTNELPATGAGDALPIVGAGLLALTGAAYYKSRRALSDTL